MPGSGFRHFIVQENRVTPASMLVVVWPPISNIEGH